MDSVQLVNPEMCKPLFGKMEANARETASRNCSGSPWGVRHTVLCLKQFFLSFAQSSAHSQTLYKYCYY